jgi:serine phosphatase RsbU (regulator of sigma subunit)
MRLLPLGVVLMLVTLFVVSCGKTSHEVHHTGKADSLINAAYKAHDYERLMLLADSLETTGNLSDVRANYWRGYVCSRQKQARRAEFYWKKVIEAEAETTEDLMTYAKAASRLSNLLVMKADYEGTLKVAVHTVEKLEEAGCDTIGDFANLLTSIANCQLHFNMIEEAAANYDRAYRKYQQIVNANHTDAAYKSSIISIITTTLNYLSAKRYADAQLWTDRFENMLKDYEAQPKADSNFIDKQHARLGFYRATALQGLGNTGEAANAYRRALETAYAKTGDGRIEANEYLILAYRWREAANNYSVLDQQMSDYGMKFSLDNIIQYLVPKYRSNVGASRRDSAIAIGMQLCSALDSAVVWVKQDDAAELATIYDTQQKEAQIAQQQIDLSRQRTAGSLIALVLITVFFSLYTYNRREATRHLTEAHQKLEDAHGKLQTAYDQLEKTTKAKERIESEVRIARDIQMSMVPSVFPDHEHVDLYAYISPARGVGGDLYDYLIIGDKLYFCLGDVSGKGVPASLFMAQAIRLFRSIAKNLHSPATIATRINNELTEDNETGMFVTMFIGLADLNTGHLSFCNAGHNPPVLGEVPDDGSLDKPQAAHYLDVESNAPIGLWPDLQFVGEEIDTIIGRPLFIYSDGLNEAENPDQEQFGDDRLLDILSNNRFKDARQVIDTLIDAVEKHRNGAEPNDDLTMMCLRIQ